MTEEQSTYDLREAVDRVLTERAMAGTPVAVVVADSTTTAKLETFVREFPDALVNVGIAEQNLVGTAVGLSLGGFTAFTANAAPFLLSRANEQVKNDVCYSKSNVKMIGLNAGVTYGPLGSTHHILDDISIVRGLGNIQIFAPSDAVEAAEIVRYACSFHGPAYIRLDKMKYPLFHGEDYSFKVGRLDRVQEGSDTAIFSMGTVLEECSTAVSQLSEQGISAALYNVPSIRPLRREDILHAVAGKRAVVTVEEHSVHGGVGSLVATSLMEAGISLPFTRIGFPEGIFVKAGPRGQIRSYYGIESEAIARIVEKLLHRGTQ